MMKKLLAAVLVLLAAPALFAQVQPEVSYADNFQSYGTQKNPPGWIDTSVGSSKPEAGGLYKTWPDPLQSSNVVFGTKQSSGKPDGNNPRIGTFSTYASKSFFGKGRFDYRGRFIRTNADSRIGFTVFSSYPEQDKYYLIGLWKQASSAALTMQFFSFGAGAPTGTTDSGFTPEPNKWYRFAIQADDVDGATLVRARFWLEGTAEPSTFSINARDSTPLRLTGGRIGIWAAVKGDAYVDDLSAKSPVDHTAPVIKFIDVPTGRTIDPTLLALYDHPAVIDVVVTDDLSTFTATTKLDGATWTPKTPITADGTHTITVHVVDGPGNVADASLTLLVDQVDPMVTIRIDGAPFANGAVFNRDVTITAAVADATTARVTSASVDGVTVALPAHVAEDKLHTVTITAVDQVGNEGSSTQTFYVDTKAPVVAVFGNGVELPDNLYFHDDVTLTWTVDDLTKDLVTATLDGQPASSGFIATAVGAHTLVVTASDKAAHSTTVTRHFTIDTSKPEVHVFANGKAFNAGTTFGAPATFTVDVVDDTPTNAPVAKVDGNTYTLGTPVSAEGAHTFFVSVTNAAGLTTELGPSPFTVDLHDPVVTLTESGQAFQNGMKFARDVVPVVAATDNFTTSPARALYVDGVLYPLDKPITSESADHTISATATDAGGRTATVGPFHFILDKTKPVVAIADGDGSPFAANALFAHPVTVKVTVVDITHVTVAATRNGASFDLGSGTAQADGSVVFTSAPITADDTYDVSVVATDEVQLVSDPVTAHFTIDQTPPAITFTAPAQNAVVGAPSILVQGTTDDAVTVIVDGRDATVDATAKTFFINDVALIEGANQVVAKGTDKAGNVGTATLTVNLDTRAPELVITAPAANACLSAAEVTVTGRVVDPHVDRVTVEGVAATLASDGTFSATVPLPSEGRVVIDVEATDGVQHAAAATLPLFVDRTKPALAITANGVPFTGGAFNRAVAILVRAADADPAPAFTVTLDGSPYVAGAAVTAEGAHTLRASARDCAGNVSDETTVSFTIDTAPLHVVSFDPAQGATIGAPRALTGTVDDDDLKSAAIEGTELTAAISGRTFTFANVPLSEGTNSFVIAVRDNAGNVTRQPYSFRLKSTTPAVEILESGAPIAAGAVFNRAITPLIRSNEPDVTPVATLNSAPYALNTPIGNDGDYTLIATATDAFGHASPPATATFTIDRTPPTITIAATVSGDHADVTGTVGGGDVTRVSVNNIVAVVSGGSYIATVPLEIGPTTIVATAVDRAGNAATASADVVRSDNRPGLVLTSPENGTTTNRPTTVVAGQLLTPGTGARVSINGVEVSVDANGAFRKPDFALIEGDNAITAAIVGTTRQVAVHVTADFTPPALKVMANGSEMIAGARYDASPQIVLQSNESGVTRLTVDGTTISGATPLLADGGHALSATARDAAGNETRVDLTFFVGAAATASGCGLSSFDPPNNSAIFADHVKISGASGGAAAVLVNGERAAVGDGGFAATVSLTQEGANSVTIQCADANGVATTDPAVTLTLYRYTSAPSITIDPIAPPATGSTVTVSGTVGEGVVSGDVNGISFTPSAGRYSVPNVSLNKGLNVVIARARNAAGRLGVATARVTLAGAAAQINITSPLLAAQSGAASIDVTGTYADADPARIAVTAAGATYAVTTKPLGDTTGTFTAANVALTPNATTTITATAFSRTNAQAQMSVDVQHLVGAPSIGITAPADNTFYRADQQNADVSGSISPIAGSIVQVNGVQAAVDSAFHFTAAVPFSSAAMQVVARVSTPDGKSATDSIRVVRFPGALAVTETFPAANAAGVDAGAVLVVLFSNSLDASTAHGGAFILADDASQTITGTAYVDNDAVSFAPNVPLAPGKRYTLTVSQVLKDLAGGALAAPFTLAFTTSASAPATAPQVNEYDKSGCLSRETITGRASVPFAKVRLDLDGVTMSTVAAGDGAFRFDFTLSGAPGYHIARVREVGADGTLSPERDVCYRINCAAPQVTGATLDRAAKTLTIRFSKSMTASTLVAAPDGTIVLGASTGTVALNASNDVATVVYTADLSTATLALTVKKEVKDAAGTTMLGDFTQTFSLESGPPREVGNGYVTGAIYDESTGRPLVGAAVRITPSTEPPTVTAEKGRYTRSLAEGAYTIEAGATGYITVWRQVVVPAGAGVVPIDIRLTRRGAEKPSGSALTITHPGDAIARAADLALPAAALGGGHVVTLTSVGAQSLAGLLPLGWSPLAAAEIAVDRTAIPAPIPGSTLGFTLTDADVAGIAAANQTLSVVQYDPARDQWRVITAVATIDNKRVSTVITTSGDYALVYPDKATGLAQPPAPHAGAMLAGVANPCAAAADACAMTKRSFAFNPPQVTPTQNAVATLITDGTVKPFPSGTAVQAYIDEQLNLSDGRVVLDPPFATDLLVYRNLAGNDGVAMFHVAPTSRAAAETLKDGVDHVRVVDYPGRIDRGTLVGAQGGRVPGDDTMMIDIPSGATQMELHASMTPMGAAELATFADRVAGFHIAGGFNFALTRSENAPPAPDLDGDGQPDKLPVSLQKPARGTFTVDAAKFATSNRQVIIAEVLPATPFGVIVRLAAPAAAAGEGIYVTDAVDSATLAVDGIARDGRYLILTADAPVAFAWGLLRNGTNGPIIANARVTAPPLGVADLTRYTGVFAVPVPAKPAAPFSLRAATLTRGEGTPAVYASSPDPNEKVRFDLVFDAAPPHLTGIVPTGEVDLGQAVVIRATFDTDLDPASVAGGITVTNLTGTVSAAGRVVTFTPTQPLQPGTTYVITVQPTIRAVNGAPFGTTASAQFFTKAIPSTSNVDPKKIRITLPDNGVSIIRGTAGAIPPHANAFAVRRGRNFVTQYQQTADDNGAFSFSAGSTAEVDRITTSDQIDLQVIDAVSHAIIAIVPLTPFVTAEGDGYLAAADATTSFTTAAGIGITVPAGAFAEPTVVRANPVDKAPFTTVPTFDEELRFNGGVRVDFDGVAKERLELDILATVPLDPAKNYYLGRLISTVRGPRIELDDTLRIDGNKLTTRLATGAAGARQIRALSIPGINTAGEVKHAMLGVVQRGDYGTVDVIPPIGWMFMIGIGPQTDLFTNLFKSIAISGFWLSEKSGKALMPVLANRPFIMEGVDQATGVTVFTKPYDVQVPVGDPLTGTALPSPLSPTRGPYPTFAAHGRIEVVDLSTNEFDDDSRLGLHIEFDGSFLTVSPAGASATVVDHPLELLNVTTGTFSQTGTFDGELKVPAKKGHRVIILGAAADVDPLANISFAFSEPLNTGSALSSLFEVGISDVGSTGPPASVNEQAKFALDSGGRRVTISFPVGLQRGKKYSITLKETIQGVNPAAGGSPLGLGQVEDTAASLSAPARPLHVEFTTRGPGGEIGSFQVRNPIDPTAGIGTARDFAVDGNILYVAGTNAGLLAYDVSDPAKLTKPEAMPFAWAPVNLGVSDTWAVATDHHGRVWAAGMTEAFGFIRGYTSDAFIDAQDGKNLADCKPDAPGKCPVPPLRGAMIISYRPGYLEALPLSTYDSGITTTITTKPEAIPRKMKILTQDFDAPSMFTEDLIATLDATSAPITNADPFVRLTLNVNYDNSGTRYYVQRVTFRNTTLNLQWSKDILRNNSATFNLIGRPGDQWVKSTNQATYGVVNLFGFGLGVYDLNELESNRWTTPPDPNADPKLEQVLISSVKYSDELGMTDCSTTLQTAPPDPLSTGDPFHCIPTALASIGQHCPIPDLTFSPESLIISGPLTAAGPPKFVIYGLHSSRGIIDFKVNPPITDPSTGKLVEPSCDKRAYGLTLADKVPWPAQSSPSAPFDHPRLNKLRELFVDAAKKANPAAPPAPFARFTSIALYVRRTASTTPGTPDTVTNYALIAAADYGLLVLKLDPSTDLDNNSLVDVVWVPSGAFSVGIVPGAQLATVTDGAGRVLVVDLTKVDESGLVQPLTPSSCSNPISCTAPLFPSAEKALASSPAAPVPGQNWIDISGDDPRVIWKAKGDPADLTRSTLAPLIDGETGILFKGDYLDPKVKIIAAADPRVRFLADLGNPKGPSEVSGVTPLGIAPKNGTLKCTPSPTCSASAGIFRLDVALPGAISESLPGSEIRVALESEPFPGVTAVQTPAGLPRAHLRKAKIDGMSDPRFVAEFRLQRLLPNVTDADIKRLRYQKAYNHFTSPWIAAVADLRASQRYVWPAGINKEEKGCFSCDRPPKWQGKREPEIFELYTAGRYLHVRPEHTSTSNTIFSGTPYAYLGAKGRLENRVATVIADTIHPPDLAVAAANPPVAGGALQDTTYLHSGEVETSAIDLDAGGRARWNVGIDRTYRSRTIGTSPLGWGWDSSNFARLRELPNEKIEYRDGAGEVWTFERVGATFHYTAKGLPLKLVSSAGGGWKLFDQQVHYMFFDQFGRLQARSDEFADPSAVLNGGEDGNIIRYFYDEKGRLSQIIDPVNRVTKIEYYPESATPAPKDGQVKELIDWRERKVTYEYDDLGRLHTGRLPEAANAVAAYDLTGGKRPFLTYDYNTTINALPPDNDLPNQQVFNNFLELAANLEAITEPAENAGANDKLPRVKFVYNSGTSPDQRDHVTDQKWPCANVVSAACAERGATFTYPSNSTASVTDILGQVRNYIMSGLFPDKHYHVRTVTEQDVPVLAEASGSLPFPLPVSLTPANQSITTTLDYDDFGNILTLQAPEYSETNLYGTINTVHPGKVLKSSVVQGGSGLYVHSEFVHDALEVRGVQLFAVGRDNGSNPNALVAADGFRVAPRAHKSRLNLERTETHKQSGRQYKEAAGYDKSGIPLKSRMYEPAASVPPTGSLPGGETQGEEREIHPITAGKYSRGRYSSSKRNDVSGPGANVSITYSSAANGGEVETAIDNARSPAVTTTITRDSMGRIVDIKVSGLPAVHETFGYDGSGHLVYHSRDQKNLGEVIEKSSVDPAGRTLTSSTDQANIGGSSGQTVGTRTDYDMAAHTVTVTHPANGSGAQAKTVTTIDNLGRPSREESTGTGTVPVRRVFAYDVRGNAAYESDGVRLATLTLHDSLGRETRRIGTDGITTITSWTPWGELSDQRTFDDSTTVAHTAHEYAKEGTPEHVNEVVNATSTSVEVRSTANTWHDGGAVTGTVVGQATSVITGPVPVPGADTRSVDQTRDTAGRVKTVDVASSSSSGTTLFGSTDYSDFDGTLPKTIKETAWQRGSASFTSTATYDALGNATTVNAPGGYIASAEFDQLGNAIQTTPAGLGTQIATYDSRGLQLTRTVPDPLGPKTIKFEYDALGGLTKYTDESGATNATSYDRDALGRVTKVTYPDGTTEETAYEDYTGIVKAMRDRVGQWLAYRYDDGGRLTEVHKIDLAGPIVVRYDYDLPGHRLHRVSNVNAACEYDDYDMLGRPRITRSIRYAPGGDLANPASLIIADVHTQQHTYSVFGMERTRWRMPAAGQSASPGNPGSSWRSWIAETRDGAGKLTQQTAESDATGAAAGFVISSTTSAGASEIATRTRNLTAGSTPVVSTYAYKDGSVAMPYEFGGGSAGPAAASGEMRGIAVRRGTATLGGSEVFRSYSAQVAGQRDTVFGNRGSLFDYDDRGRLANSKLHLESLSLLPNPGTTETLTEADFRKRRQPTAVFSPSQHTALGAEALKIEPPEWSNTENSAHRIGVRTLLLDGVVKDTRAYAFAGGRRTSDGEWISSYDEFGRLVQLESGDRRIVATYDPLNRLVGRTAYKSDGGSWVIEDRTEKLTLDGLPASTTFVWDGVSDRLLTITVAGSAAPGVTDPEAGLLRQYVHGDRGYDDPVEVLVADGSAKRYLPIVDEAATGSIDAIVDGATGNVVERVLYGDAYGDAPRYLQGPVVDKLTLEVTKEGSDNVAEVNIRFHLTDAVSAASAATGVRVMTLKSDGADAITTPVGTASVGSTDLNTVLFRLTGIEWNALRSAAGAVSLQLAVTTTLRTPAWGDIPVSPAPTWAKTLYGVTSTTALPLIARESLPTLEAFINRAQVGATTAYPTIYAIKSLYAAGAERSKTKLFTGFKSAPFVEPASGFAYFRARWYSPTDGQWLTADSVGYRDSSNLYAGFALDPVNNNDPLGLESIRQMFHSDQDIAEGHYLKGYSKKTGYFLWNATTFGFLGRHDALFEQYENTGDTDAYWKGTSVEVGRAAVIAGVSFATGGLGGGAATTLGGAVLRGAAAGTASGVIVTGASDVYDRATGGEGASLQDYAAGAIGGAVFGGVAGAIESQLGRMAAARANFIQRQSEMLGRDAGYNISPEEWFTRHSALGRAGTFLTDYRAVGEILGPVRANQRFTVGLFSRGSQISYFRAWRLERALGLSRTSLWGGFRVTRIPGIAARYPRSPFTAIGNKYFRGGGMGLPGGGPEVTVNPVPTSPWPP